jgi:hypothetical protein
MDDIHPLSSSTQHWAAGFCSRLVRNSVFYFYILSFCSFFFFFSSRGSFFLSTVATSEYLRVYLPLNS